MDSFRWIACLLITAALIVFAIVVFSPERYSKLHNLNEDYKRISALNMELREQNENLSKQLESLKENGILVEIIARNELGMIKEGEKVFVIEENKQQAPVERNLP